MNNFIDNLAEKLTPLAGKLGSNRYLAVLRDAFMLSFPLTMFGSIVVVLNNLPFWSDDMKGTLGGLFGNGQNATMSIMTIFITFGIGYYLTRSYDEDGIFGGAVSLASYLILTPFNFTTADGAEVSGALSLDRLGAKGMFIGMLAAFIAAEIYVRITKKGIVIKMPEGVPDAVARSFAALIPAISTLTVFLLLNALVSGVFTTNLHDVVYTVIQKPLVGLGSSLPATLVSLFFVQILWFFGLHGQIIVNSVMDPIWNTLALENLDAFKAGEALPHIITKPFMETFTVGLGGSGMTLMVVILMAFRHEEPSNEGHRSFGDRTWFIQCKRTCYLRLADCIERIHRYPLDFDTFNRNDRKLLINGIRFVPYSNRRNGSMDCSVVLQRYDGHQLRHGRRACN